MDGKENKQQTGDKGRARRAKEWRLGLIPKVMLSSLLVLAIMAGGLTFAVHSTFEPNLSRYLQRVEAEEISPLAELLGQEYERAGGWGFLSGDPGAWPRLVSRVLHDPTGSTVGPGGLTTEVSGMLPRLSVLDAEGRPLPLRPLPPGNVNGTQMTAISLPIMAGGKQVGTLQMRPTPVPVSGLDKQFASDKLHAFYLAAIPAVLLTLLIAIPLGYHFVKPLHLFKQRLHALAEGDYNVRLPIRRNDELGQLASDINHLAEALQLSQKQRREGMASVSHELRTPLSTMIAAVEAMKDGIRPLNAEQLQRLEGTMDHLRHLVDDLYQLALEDVGELTCNKEVVRWDSLVDDSLVTARDRLARCELSLVQEIDSDVRIHGDPLRLRQIMSNLVENCCRYSQAPGEVTVSLRRDDGSAVLTVRDTGPGVEAEKLGTLFDRFYRADLSDKRNYGGAGLGLALVKAIVEAHEGKVRAFNVPHGGLAVRIDIPLL